MITQRKFPRVPVYGKARVALSKKPPEDCTLLDVSAEGVAIKVCNGGFTPARGDKLTVSMNTGMLRVEIPGRVSYTLATRADEVVIGVKLHLEVSGAATRETWYCWVHRLFGSALPAATA
jgi:hypothetical protein